MASAYALADLVVCRAGASTIAELAACGKPSILIPYPHAANDHQRRNAEALAGIGGAFLLPDEELNGSRLAGLIEQCYRDPEGRRIMGMKAGSFARVDADERVAELILSLIREGERSKEELPC
jgi:UDP-N-acetylglucosamine--N-acetylmuramyl-(pentapeptide) pyrophosphoryl-undecaprenol N-acetylglucosamine transferase